MNKEVRTREIYGGTMCTMEFNVLVQLLLDSQSEHVDQKKMIEIRK